MLSRCGNTEVWLALCNRHDLLTQQPDVQVALVVVHLTQPEVSTLEVRRMNVVFKHLSPHPSGRHGLTFREGWDMSCTGACDNVPNLVHSSRSRVAENTNSGPGCRVRLGLPKLSEAHKPSCLVKWVNGSSFITLCEGGRVKCLEDA